MSLRGLRSETYEPRQGQSGLRPPTYDRTLRRLLSDCVAVPAEPESVEYVHTESRPQSLQKAEGELKDTLGLMLREAWDKQGKSGCRHPETSKETSFSGTVTGWYLCTTCGHRLRMDQV